MSPVRLKLPSALATWWSARLPRERRVLAWGGGLLVPLVLVFGIALPGIERVHTLQDRIQAQDRQLVEMRSIREALRAGAAAKPVGDSPIPDAALAARLEASAAAELGGFRGSLRMTEEGLVLGIDSAPFDDLLGWLEKIQKRERLFAAEARLVAVAEPGRVGGRIRFAAGGAR